MIICLCNNISYEQVSNLIKENKTLEEIKSTYGLGSSCGSCVEVVKEEIEKMKKYNKYIGMKEEDVLKLIPQSVNVRVIDVDGFMTADFVPDRLNIVVDKGIVKRVFEG